MADKILYHYTSLDALVNILDTEEEYFILRASQANFLNDYEENEYFFKKFNTYLSSRGISPSIKMVNEHQIMKETLKQNFIISFSECSDSLSLWRGYGNQGAGVSIGISFDFMEKNLKKNNFIVKCIYKDIYILNKIRAFFDVPKLDFFCDNFKDLFSLILGCKNPSFNLEKEWRICKSREDEVIKFRSSGKSIIPYIEYKIKKDAIKKVVIGPCLNSNLISEGVSQLLKNRNYNLSNIDVLTSKIPYRQL